MEATTGIEPVMEVLQTSALPLGYVAPSEFCSLYRYVIVVPRMRLELIRPFGHRPLKTACLPIPPPRHVGGLSHERMLAGVEGFEPPACCFGDSCSAS